MAQDRAGNCQARAHVAAGHLHHRRARAQPAVGAGRKQDRAGRPVLHAAAGLQELRLGQDAPRPGMSTVESDQRRAADQVQGGGRDMSI